MEHQVQIKADDVTIKENYANVAMIGHTRKELTLDSINIFQNQGMLLAWIIMSQGRAKRLLSAPQANIDQYEKGFKVTIGTI